MNCPKDLCEWVTANPKAMWFVYDLNLMPEQITTKEEVCALRGFQYGWVAREKSAQHSVQRIGLLARISKWFGAIANR